MRILSLDPGTRNCGYAVFEESKLLCAGCIRTNPPVYAGLLEGVSALCGEYAPDLVVIEGVFRRKGYAAFHLEASGIIKAVLEQKGVKRMSYVPTEWKKLLLGNGRAKKQEVMLFLRKRGYRVKSSHEADALALALAYLTEKGGKNSGNWLCW